MESDEALGAQQPPRERADWNVPLPSQLSGSSFWPAGLAFSIFLLAWGPAFFYTVSWLTLSSGAVLFFVSLRGWLRELRDEMRGAA